MINTQRINKSVRIGAAAIVGTFLLWSAARASASPLHVTSGQTVVLGALGISTNYNFDSVTVDDGGTIQILGDVTLTVSTTVQVDGEINGDISGVGDTGSSGTAGAAGTVINYTAQVGDSGGNGGNGGSLLGAVSLTIYAQSMTVNGAIHLDTALDGGDGGSGGKGGRGADGLSPESPQNAKGGDGGFGGGGGNGGFGGDAGGGSELTVTLNGQFVLGSGGVISLDNTGKGGDGGKAGDGGDGGAGGNATLGSPGGKGGMGGFGGFGGDGGNGSGGGYFEIDASSVDLEGEISMQGGDGGNGGDVGAPANGGKGGDGSTVGGTSGNGGNGGDAGNALVNSYPSPGTGGNGGFGGLLYVNAVVFTDNAQFDFTGGAAGAGGNGQSGAAASGGAGGKPGGTAHPGKKGADSLPLADGITGLQGHQGLMELKVDNHPVGTLYGWAASGSGVVSFGFDTNTAAYTIAVSGGSQNFSVSGNLADPRSQYNASTFQNVVEQDEPVELSFGYQWLSTNGSVDVMLGGQNVMHLQPPGVLTNGLSQADAVITSHPQPDANGNLNFSFQVNGGAQMLSEGLTIKALPNVPMMSITLSATNSAVANLRWYGATNENYQVQYRDSLNTGTWTNLSSVLLGHQAATNLPSFLAPDAPRRFYRLKMTPAN